MSEKGTYSDPRCYGCRPALHKYGGAYELLQARVAADLRRHKPYRVWRYDRVMDRIADAINKRIPGPELILTDDNVVRVNDVLRRARSE